MNKIENEQLKNKLDDLTKFLARNDVLEEDIVAWVSDCVSIFSQLKIPAIIISDFINYYKPRENNPETIAEVRVMGNFEKNKFHNLNNFYKPKYRSYLSYIAFKVAKNILKKIEEEERVVPFWLIKNLLDKREYSNILSSLNLIEQNYEDNDGDGIVKNSIALLENILDLHGDLKIKDTLSNKLRTAINSPEIMEKFGVTKEFVYALDNSRLVRNIQSTHKRKKTNYDIPFLVAVSSAYLIILMLEITISTGELVL